MVGPETDPGHGERVLGILGSKSWADAAALGVHWVPGTDQPLEWMRAADLFLTASEYEGMPLAPLEAVVSQNQLLRVASAVKTEREDGTEALIVVAKADGIRLAKDYFYSLSAQDRGRLLLKALIANGDLPAVPRTGELDAALALLENIDSQTDSLTLATELRSKVYCRGPLYNILTLDVPLTPQEALITPCTVGF
jgi:hypothetical protein